MAHPQDKRVMQLRRLVKELEASPPSPERDRLLHAARVRLVDAEAPEELGAPSASRGLAGA